MKHGISLTSPPPFLTLPFAAALFALISPLSAQDEEEAAEAIASSNELPTTVIVGRTSDIATRSEKKLSDVPEAVSVITPEDIARINPLSFDDLIRTVPNVETQGGPRYLGEQIIIRGEGGNAVTVRLDDARQNFVSGHAGQRFFVETDFLQSVDILRGAGSFLYGSGSAGVINLTTVDPVDILNEGGKYGVRIRNTYHDNSDEWANSFIGAIAPTESLAFLYGYSARQGNDILLGNGQFLNDSAIDRNSHLAKLVWSPSDIQRLELGFSTYDTSDEGGANPQSDVDTSNALVGRGIDYRQWTANYQLNPLSDMVDLDFTLYYNETTQVRNYLATTGNNVGRLNQHQLDVFGIDVANRSLFTTGKLEHELIAGLEFFGETQEGIETRDTFFIPGAPGASSGRPNAEADHFGLYLTDEVDLSEKFTLFGGVRYDSYSTEKTIGAAATQEDSAFSPNIGFDLDINEKLSLVGRFCRAFSGPTLNNLYQDGSHFGIVPISDNPEEFFVEISPGSMFAPAVTEVRYFEEVFVSNPNLLPEESNNFELALHFEDEDVAGGQLSARLTGFYKKGENTFDSEIVGTSVNDSFSGGFATPDDVFITVPTGPFTTATFPVAIFNESLTQAFRQTVNREETQIYGAEITLDYDADCWFGGLTFGSIRGQDTTTGADLNSLTGDQFTANVGVRLLNELVELGIYGIWNNGKEELVSDPTFQTSGYDIYGLFSTFQARENWQIRFGIDNVFDQSYERTSTLLKEPGRNVFVSSTLEF
ncbi:MAG: TonB-dependent receptor [Verrucomicrobiota bacterium]